MKPLLSVLMITYNHEAFIARSIESVLAQKTDFPIELVIGDDHSTDNTAAIANTFATKHPGIIRFLSHENNLGVIPNFQHTLQRCNGKYIAMLEGDDRWIDEKKLQKQVDFLEKNPDYVLCGGHTISESTNTTFIYSLIRQYKFLTQKSFRFQSYELDEVIIANHFKTLTVVFRAACMQQPLHKAFHSSTILDWLIYISLGMNNGMQAKYANLPDIVAAYNVHAGGIFSGTSTLRRLQIFADVRNCINAATDNYYFGYHYPVLILNDAAGKPSQKESYLAKLDEVYAPAIHTTAYHLDKAALVQKIRKDIVKANMQTLGYFFARTYISSPNFDAFTAEIVQFLKLLHKSDVEQLQKEKMLRALSAAWRACMFYDTFTVKTIFLFLRSLLLRYSDIYVYTLILTLYQNSKR